MQRDINKSNPHTLHEDRYIRYFSQVGTTTVKDTIENPHASELQSKELTIRNIGILCDKLFNSTSKYH